MLGGVVWTVDGCGNIGDICGAEGWRVLLITREGVSYHSTIEPNELLQETGTPRTSAIFDQTSTTSIPFLEWVLESCSVFDSESVFFLPQTEVRGLYICYS